ncbi:FadR/GntR family transcriptional regulator [Fonticella tunisiensis]|uniref:GntR family transcriptional regulator n=1 Tax=Fonticella tunisiensis TaxID=1096341 RepID=A0A4R7KAQ1_9CLOT|nr:FadR/GntR family transcriptional regulator [Fonticella tunisiensis]TDT51953.1 GntR family transcriptional regulator [Fonticella tunisiensis]
MFKPIKSTKVYEQVVEQIKGMIMDGTLKKGDKLPAERDLAEQLQVSRASIREAIRVLEVIGLVESRQGGGNFIRESFENSLFEPLSMVFMLEKSKPQEILELRRIMEIETAALAARKINDKDLEAIREIIEEMKKTDDEIINAALDKEFHYRIAHASGNVLVLNILNAVSILIDEFIKGAREMIVSNEENRHRLAEQHEEIYIALKNHNQKGAIDAMKKHFDFVDKYYY